MASRRAPFAIVGPTASGKTALALDLATHLGDTELVSVDAIAVYRGLDIGAAKPSAGARTHTRWHLLDVAEPAEEFSASRFTVLARAAIDDIEGRGKRVGLVGGTGLYHRAVIDDLDMPGRYPEVASRLEAEAAAPGGLAALYARLGRLDPLAQSRIEPNNLRRIVRALEVTEGSGRPFSASGPGLGAYPDRAWCQVGLSLERAELDRRIEARLDHQLASGFLEEVKALAAATGGLSRTARQALGYRELLAHLEEGLGLDAARELILSRTRSFARRQQAWFRRDPRITWLDATRPDLLIAALALVLGEGSGGAA